MLGVLIDNQGRALTNGTGVFTTIDGPFIPPKYTGTVDREGLTALGWDSYDIDWLQQHVWWNKEDNDYWKVSEANLAFGPNGSTPLTFANRSTIKQNPEVRYFPKFDPSPSSNTSWANLFNGYQYLYAIPTHGWNTSKVTSFNNFVYNCFNLVSVGDLSGWVSNVCTTIAAMFYGCTNLLEIGNISGWNTTSVTSFSSVFYYCAKLRNIGSLSNWSTANVTTFASMFNYCLQLDDIGNLSNWNTANATNMASMFNYCFQLKRLIGLTNWNVEKVTTLASFCANCYNLEYIDSLTNWNTLKLTTISSMFNQCYNLKSIGSLANWSMGLVTTIYNAFSNCTQLEYIGDLKNWNVSKINGTTTSSGYIGAFNGCYNLRNLGDLSNWSITMTGTKNQMNSLFAGCYNLDKLNVKNWDVSKVINFQYTFSNTRKLQELDVSGWDLSAATNIGTSAGTNLFTGMYNLKTLKLGPNFFNSSSITTYYFSHLTSWTPESIVDSLYTKQTNRTSSSTLITIQIAAVAFDRLNADLPSGFTLTNSTTITIDSKNIKLVRT